MNLLQQSLIIWATAPIFILLITLFSFLIYFCRRCCQKNDTPKSRPIQCMRISALVLALVSM